MKMRVRYDICFVFANRDKLPAILKSGLHLSFLTALNYDNGFILAQRRQTFKVLHKLAILERKNFSNQMVSQSYYFKKKFVKSFSPLRRKTAKLRHNKSWTMNVI